MIWPTIIVTSFWSLVMSYSITKDPDWEKKPWSTFFGYLFGAAILILTWLCGYLWR